MNVRIVSLHKLDSIQILVHRDASLFQHTDFLLFSSVLSFLSSLCIMTSVSLMQNTSCILHSDRGELCVSLFFSSFSYPIVVLGY